MASSKRRTRPRAVTLTASLHVLEGVVMLPVGFLFAASGVYGAIDPEALLESAEAVEIAAIGSLLAAIGLAAFVIAYGLFRLRPWAWLLAMASQGASLGLALWARTTGNPEYVSMALGVLIVLALNQAEVRAAFHEREAELD